MKKIVKFIWLILFLSSCNSDQFSKTESNYGVELEKYAKEKNISSAYLKALMAHKFAICPEGNGTDTHRFWECLYLKTIPICLKSPVTVYYSKMYPVFLLDDWSDFSSTDLTYFYNTADWSRYDTLFFDRLSMNLF